MSNPRVKFEKAEQIKKAQRNFEFLQAASVDKKLQRENESGGLILGPRGIAASTLVKIIRDNLDQAKVGLEVLLEGKAAEEINDALLAASGGNLDKLSDLVAADRVNKR